MTLWQPEKPTLLQASFAELIERLTPPAPRVEMTLLDFVREMWPVVEPGVQYVHGWHIEVICEHLEAMSAGQIQNLIINVPPRHMKSLLVSVFWPAWIWTRHPHKKFMYGSYDLKLSIRDAIKTRRLIRSPLYQARFKDRFELSGDQNQKMRYENDKGGFRVATSTTSGITGEGGDVIVADDPHKAKDAFNPDLLRTANEEWWDATMSSRGNDPRTVLRLVIMQRIHDIDLTGHINQKQRQDGSRQYDHLVLPARYEPSVYVCGADLEHDRRQLEGELLWPARMDEKALTEMTVDMTEDIAAGQLQQRPTQAGGSVFKREWFEGDRNRYDFHDQTLARRTLYRYMTVDSAFKDGEENDYTAIMIAELLRDYTLLIREITLSKVQFFDLIPLIQDTAREWNYDGKLEAVVIEDKASGISALQQLQSGTDPPWLAGIIKPFLPLGSKIYRAKKAALWPSRDMVKLPYPDEAVNSWLIPFAGPEPHGTLFRYPNIEHDDDIDTFSSMIDYLWMVLAEGWRLKKRAEKLAADGIIELKVAEAS